jgi:5-methylcytosine-specific restriction endonuclease McrA
MSLMKFPKDTPIRDKKLLDAFSFFCSRHYIGCLYCGSIDIQIHHGVYRSQQGSDEFDNLYPLCQYHHEIVHHFGKPKYYEIVELKAKLFKQLEFKLDLDLSEYYRE